MHYLVLITYGWVLITLGVMSGEVHSGKSCLFHHFDLSFPVSEKFGKDPSNFNSVLDVLEESYKPIVREMGGELIINRNWDSSESNAYAWRDGNKYILEFPGGMSRYPGMSIDGFALIACHEMGHLLGGYPARENLSYEGQADYFASYECMQKIIPYVGSPDYWVDDYALESCRAVYDDEWDLEVCLRTFEAGLNISKIFARFDGSDSPNFLTPDLTEVESTVSQHPYAQCRLDTYVAGAVLDYRPRCWYRP